MNNFSTIKSERSTDLKEEEDPCIYKSKVTNRGPLPQSWLKDIKETEPDQRGGVMCSYKLCKVEFRYWVRFIKSSLDILIQFP